MLSFPAHPLLRCRQLSAELGLGSVLTEGAALVAHCFCPCCALLCPAVSLTAKHVPSAGRAVLLHGASAWCSPDGKGWFVTALRRVCGGEATGAQQGGTPRHREAKGQFHDGIKLQKCRGEAGHVKIPWVSFVLSSSPLHFSAQCPALLSQVLCWKEKLWGFLQLLSE